MVAPASATPDWIGSVVSLTGDRDRDRLDATVVAVLADWLQPRALRMLHCDGAAGQTRVRLGAGVQRDAPPLAAEAAWLPAESLPASTGWPCHAQALASGAPQVATDAGQGGGVLSVVPHALGGERRVLIEARGARALTAEQLRLVDGVLRIYRNQIDLLDYGERDGLTGLLNRKTFEAQFGKCLLCEPAPVPAERRMPSRQHWLGVIDVDRFKSVNDRYGHLIGDEVLLLVGRLLRGVFRQDDRIYRFGGEEFVVLLQAGDRAGAHGAFERFRAAMAAYRFPQVGAATVSIGYTALRRYDTASAAFERADAAVYAAKHAGRDRVLCHEALVEDGRLPDEREAGAIELF